MKTLVLDIETRPHLGYVWSLWDQNVGLSQIAETGSVICVAAKWIDEKKVHFFSDYHDGHDEMLEAIWDLVDRADVVVGYNSRSFDMKHLAREWIVAGLDPPSPYRDIDLLTAVRHRFKFASAKLAHVSVELGLDGKAETGGFELWKACMSDDPAAWAKMKRYNVQDVRLTEELYYRVRPWLPTSSPNAAIFIDSEDPRCPRCTSDDVIRWGYLATNAGTYRRFKCKGCGSYARATKRLSTTELRAVS